MSMTTCEVHWCSDVCRKLKGHMLYLDFWDHNGCKLCWCCLFPPPVFVVLMYEYDELRFKCFSRPRMKRTNVCSWGECPCQLLKSKNELKTLSMVWDVVLVYSIYSGAWTLGILYMDLLHMRPHVLKKHPQFVKDIVLLIWMNTGTSVLEYDNWVACKGGLHL